MNHRNLIRSGWNRVALFATWAAASCVLASGEATHGDAGHGHAAEAAGGPNILTGDLGNVFWTLVIFVILLVVLRLAAWGPIRAALQGREKFILDSLAGAKKDRADAEAMLRKYTEQVERARAEASAIVEEGKRDAEAVRKRIQEEARAEAQTMLDRAKRELGIARDDAIKQLHQQSIELATSMAGRLVQRQLKPEDQRALLDEALGEFSAVRD